MVGAEVCRRRTGLEREEGKLLPSDFHEAVRLAKQQIVMAALTGAGGNRGQAARQLGLHPNNLHRLIRNLGLQELGS
jgi:DNA-binding NtrC family response regulator